MGETTTHRNTRETDETAVLIPVTLCCPSRKGKDRKWRRVKEEEKEGWLKKNIVFFLSYIKVSKAYISEKVQFSLIIAAVI